MYFPQGYIITRDNHTSTRFEAADVLRRSATAAVEPGDVLHAQVRAGEERLADTRERPVVAQN